MSTATRPGPTTRAEYARFLPISLRWMDNDVFGHLNNVHYYSLFDTAICEFMVTHGVLTWGGEHLMVIAESGCRYHSEVAFPDQIAVGIRAGRIGDRSVRWELGLFRDGAELASADGFMVHVCVDAASRRPVRLPVSLRAVISMVEQGS